MAVAVIKSTDRLFFVSHNIGANDSWEWRLARIAFNDSVSIYPSCTLDGRFLFDFYICHPANWRYNAVNQHYWIQFHGREDIIHPSLTTETHLVRPSDTSDDYAKRHNLLPFQKWLKITHLDTFIHSPFEFATVRGRKTRDRICQDDWDVLRKSTFMFQNPLPAFNVPRYSIHVDWGTHVTYHNQALMNVLGFETSQTSNTLQDKRYPWQKVIGQIILLSPNFFLFFLCKRKLSSFLREPTTILWTLGFVSHQCRDYCYVWWFESFVEFSRQQHVPSSNIFGPLKGLSPYLLTCDRRIVRHRQRTFTS